MPNDPKYRQYEMDWMKDSRHDSPTWEHVYKMSLKMEEKLSQNRHKGNRENWIKDSPRDLIFRLKEELTELINAINNEEHSEEVWKEAADIANFAMMIADSYEESKRNK